MLCASGLFSIKTTKDIGTHILKLNIFGWKTEISSLTFVNFFTFSFTLPHLNASNNLIFTGNYQDFFHCVGYHLRCIRQNIFY